MKQRLVLLSVLFVALLALAGVMVYREALLGANEDATLQVNDVPVPGLEETDETIVGENGKGGLSQQMPVPGFEGVPEMIVVGEDDQSSASSGMPVPGLEGVEESIVIEQ